MQNAPTQGPAFGRFRYVLDRSTSLSCNMTQVGDDLTTNEDGEVKLTIPPGSQTGQQLRLKGKGLPTRSEVCGNILVTLKVVVPTELSIEERSLFEQLSKASSFDPR